MKELTFFPKIEKKKMIHDVNCTTKKMIYFIASHEINVYSKKNKNDIFSCEKI